MVIMALPCAIFGGCVYVISRPRMDEPQVMRTIAWAAVLMVVTLGGSIGVLQYFGSKSGRDPENPDE
jgi:hypothetical protein